MHQCTHCGATWHTRERIVVKPVLGDLKDFRTTVDPADLLVVGNGKKLRRFFHADWVRRLEPILHDDSIFGFCRDHGVVEVCGYNLKQLRARLGDDFVSVEKSILVSLGASLLLNPHEKKMCGIRIRGADGTPTVHWVIGSRRGIRCLRKALFGKRAA